MFVNKLSRQRLLYSHIWLWVVLSASINGVMTRTGDDSLYTRESRTHQSRAGVGITCLKGGGVKPLLPGHSNGRVAFYKGLNNFNKTFVDAVYLRNCADNV